MKFRIFLLTIIIASQLLMSGCWDYIEYENLAQVIAIGIDYDKNTHESTVSFQYLSTSGQSKGQSEGGGSSKSTSGTTGLVHSATDKTLLDAFTTLQEVIAKRPFYGYCKLIVIGEEAAKYNIMDILELFDRTPVLRSISHFAVTSSKAEDVIKTVDISFSIASGIEVHNLINLAENTGAAYTTTLNNFIQMLAVSGLEPTAPRVIVVPAKSPSMTSSNISQGDIRYDEKQEGDIRVSGMAAFKADRFIGWLNDKESLGFGWISGKKIRVYKTFEVTNDIQNTLYYRITKSKTKVKIKMMDNMPIIDINIKLTADLRKYYINNASQFLSPAQIKDIEDKLSKSILSDIQTALKKGQKELKSDIFGFGFEFFREHPKLWQSEYKNKWDQIYPDVKVNVNVDSKIINTGTNIRKLDIQ